MSYIKYLRDNYESFKHKSKNYIMIGDLICDDVKTNTKGKKIIKKDYKKIHVDLLPQPVIGNLKNAEIIICSCNPGFDNSDYMTDRKYHKEILEQLNQNGNDMIWLKPGFSSTAGGKWWRKKINGTVKKIEKNANNINDDRIYDFLAKNIVALELFPYHSYKANYPVMFNCDSVLQIKKYMHDVIIPNIGNKLLIFTRSTEYWGICDQTISKSRGRIIKAINPRNFSFNPNTMLGDAIFNKIYDLTKGFTKHI